MRTLFKPAGSTPCLLRRASVLASMLALTLASPVHAEPAQSLSASLPASLSQAFAAAWARQPAAAALFEQRSAVAARRAAADAWTPVAPAIEVGGRSDRFNRDRGANEMELGLAIPLWLPGERRDSQAFAEAETGSLEGRVAALQWQLAGELRAAWWDWQLANEEFLAAEGALASSARLRDDVARRFAAGDLARTDLYQAEGALAGIRAEWIDAQSRRDATASRLLLLTGKTSPGQGPATPMTVPQEKRGEPDPGAEQQPGEWLARHPALVTLNARAEVARQTQALARTRSRANPELMLATRRERGTSGEAMEQSWSLALRIPFSSEARHRAAIAEAGAGRVEAEIEAERERERLTQGVRLALAQLAAARQRLQANEERARLARETDLAFDKAFRLGESDLPTRLRIAQETFAAERAAQRARIQQAAALSAYRQALGLLPE
jgi:outer membrane protein, heavy metal efflux system